MDMSSVATLSPRELDVRARIVEIAEALFRDIGYQKTTVADIAKALKMSPANVYRFFDSKKSINEAVAERVTAAVRARMAAIAGADRPAGERLRDLLRTMNACMCELGVSEAKIAGPCIRASMIQFCHPAIIAQCHDMPLPTLDQQIEFVLAAVRTR